jgi:hypothetical protein
MKNDSNKNAIVPPGAQPGRLKDQDEMKPVEDPMQPDGKRMCPCCHAIVPVDNYIILLRKCIECANTCDGENECQQNKCKCPGDCCAEHKAGTKCADTITLVIGKVGQALLEVCTACAIELAKKMLLP